MSDTERLAAGVHEQYAADAARLGSQLRDRTSDQVRTLLTEHAQAAARDRDDNHVGTEHLLLGLYADPSRRAVGVLTARGIPRDVLQSVLDDEPGPSPVGFIPYTTRAMMIGGLAVLEADSTGAETVDDVHVLLGAIAESRRWQQDHAWGPHHLRAAAQKAGTSLEEIERDARALVGDG